MVRWQTQLQITFTRVILSSKEIGNRINIVLSKFQRLTLNIVPWLLLNIVMVLPTVPARKKNIPISDWEVNYHRPNFIRVLKTRCSQSACLTLCHGSIALSHSPDALYWPLAISVYQSSKENSSHRGIFENIFISFFLGGGRGGETGKQKMLNTKSKHTNKLTFKTIQEFIISCFQHPYLLVKVNLNK